MALLMKAECEKCQKPLPVVEAAFICTYECTFCPDCSVAMSHTCPNCSGELVARPRRK
jgi:uncharacterized protein